MFLILSLWLAALFFLSVSFKQDSGQCNKWFGLSCFGSTSLSFSFPFVRGGVLSTTSSPPHLTVFSILPCLVCSPSSLPPLLPSSHLSQHSPPILALASLVSSCSPHVTLPLSSVVCHQPSFLRVLPTVVCSSPVALSSSSALLYLPSWLLLFFVPSCFRTLVAFVVVDLSLPRFPFRTGMPMSHHASARDLALQSFWGPPVRHHPATALHGFTPASALRRRPRSTYFSVFPSPHNALPRYTQLSSWVSFSPQARCPALPGESSLCWPMCTTSFYNQTKFSSDDVTLDSHDCIKQGFSNYINCSAWNHQIVHSMLQTCADLLWYVPYAWYDDLQYSTKL